LLFLGFPVTIRIPNRDEVAGWHFPGMRIPADPQTSLLERVKSGDITLQELLAELQQIEPEKPKKSKAATRGIGWQEWT